MSNVFISYNHKDVNSASQLVHTLTSSGIDVWWDKRLFPQNEFDEDISQAVIRQVNGLIVLLSPDAKTSRHVAHEITYAFSYDKRIIPVLVRGKFQNSTPKRLLDFPFIDIQKDYQAGVKQLLSVFEELNGNEGVSVVPYSFNTLIEEFKSNPQMLVKLSQFNAHLFSLLMIHHPDADYLGVRDENLLAESVLRLRRTLPELLQKVLQDEYYCIKHMIEQKNVVEARQRVHDHTRLISTYLSEQEVVETS